MTFRKAIQEGDSEVSMQSVACYVTFPSVYVFIIYAVCMFSVCTHMCMR